MAAHQRAPGRVVPLRKPRQHHRGVVLLHTYTNIHTRTHTWQEVWSAKGRSIATKLKCILTPHTHTSACTHTHNNVHTRARIQTSLGMCTMVTWPGRLGDLGGGNCETACWWCAPAFAFNNLRPTPPLLLTILAYHHHGSSVFIPPPPPPPASPAVVVRLLPFVLLALVHSCNNSQFNSSSVRCDSENMRVSDFFSSFEVSRDRAARTYVRVWVRGWVWA